MFAFVFLEWYEQKAVAVMSYEKPIGSHEAVIFFLTAVAWRCCQPPTGHPEIFSSKFLSSCRACCQVFHLQTLSL